MKKSKGKGKGGARARAAAGAAEMEKREGVYADPLTGRGNEVLTWQIATWIDDRLVTVRTVTDREQGMKDSQRDYVLMLAAQQNEVSEH